MTPNDLAKNVATCLQQMKEQDVFNLSPGSVLQVGLLHNILGMLTVIASQNDEIIRRMPLPEEPKIITP